MLTTSLTWLALGQPLSALPDYVSTGISVVQGYVDAMGYNMLGGAGQWEVLILIVSAARLQRSRVVRPCRRPLRRRAALAGCVVLVHYFVAREMLVRYDPGHAAVLVLLVAVPLLIPWRSGQRATRLAMAAGLAAVSLGRARLRGPHASGRSSIPSVARARLSPT